MDFDRINAQLLERAEELCEDMLPGGHDAGNEWVCADMDGGEGRSTSVNISTGMWADFSQGEETKGGDLVSLIAACMSYAQDREVRQGEAYRNAEAWLRTGLNPAAIVSIDKGSERTLPETNSQTLPETGDDWWRYVLADRIWDYRNADGKVIFQVKRWNARPDEGKAKVIRPWDVSGDGRLGFPKGVVRPLLNLPEIIERAEELVMLVAGEKCVDAVMKLGVLATTNAGGESAMGQTDLTPLEGRDIILWADNDDAGTKWIKKLTGALGNVGAASVRVVETPKNKPNKWDAADAELGERDTLVEAAWESPPVMQSAVPLAAEIILPSEQPGKRNWIVIGSILLSKLSVLFGPGGCGKSLSVLDMAIKIAARNKRGVVDPNTFLGRIPEDAQGPVLYITMEDDHDEIGRRLWSLDPDKLSKSAPLYIVSGLEYCGFDPALWRQNGRLAALTQFATEVLPRLITNAEKKAGGPLKLLIFDPAGDFIDGSEDDAAIVKPLMRWLRELATKHNMAILLIGHDAKGQKDSGRIMNSGMRGSGAWTANARAAFGLWRPSGNEAVKFLTELGFKTDIYNVERVIFGRSIKVNFLGQTPGTRRFIQNEKTGVLEDPCADTQIDATDKQSDRFKRVVLGAIRISAEQGYPFTQTSPDHGIGRSSNRYRLPPMLRDEKLISGAEINRIIVELLSSGEIKRRNNWHGRKGVIDVPNGPVYTNKPGFAPRDSWDYVYESDASEK